MDFNGLLLVGFLWLVVNLIGRAKGDSRPKARTLPNRPPGPQGPPVRAGSEPLDTDATQREGSQLERLLRELERNMEEAGGFPGRSTRASFPAPTPLPDAEEIEDRTSLEEPERVVSLEQEVVRAPRVRVDYDEAAEGIERRRIEAAAARSGELTKADHTRFDQRIREELPDHTAVRKYTPAQLRDAIVWREILGPPVSERRLFDP